MIPNILAMKPLSYLWLINVLFIIDCALNRRQLYWFVILVCLGPLGALAYGIYFFNEITFPFPLGKTWRKLTGKKVVRACPRCGIVSEIKAHQDGRQVHYMCQLCIERTFAEEPSRDANAAVQAAEAIAQRGKPEVIATVLASEPEDAAPAPEEKPAEVKPAKEKAEEKKPEEKPKEKAPEAEEKAPKAEEKAPKEPKKSKKVAKKAKPKKAKPKKAETKKTEEEIPALPAPKPVEVSLWGQTLKRVVLPGDIEKAFNRVIKLQKKFGADHGQPKCLHQVEFFEGDKFLPSRVSNEQLSELFNFAKELVPEAMEGHQVGDDWTPAQLRNQVKALDVDRAADWLERNSLKKFGEKDSDGKFATTEASKKGKKKHDKLFDICLDFLLDDLEDPVALYTLTPRGSKYSVSFISGGSTGALWITVG